jgi:hypothetical protein
MKVCVTFNQNRKTEESKYWLWKLAAAKHSTKMKNEEK